MNFPPLDPSQSCMLAFNENTQWFVFPVCSALCESFVPICLFPVSSLQLKDYNVLFWNRLVSLPATDKHTQDRLDLPLIYSTFFFFFFPGEQEKKCLVWEMWGVRYGDFGYACPEGKWVVSYIFQAWDHVKYAFLQVLFNKLLQANTS